LRVQKAAETFAKLPAVSSATGPVEALRPFRYMGWPGAGRPKLAWDGTAEALALRRAPDRSEAVAAAASLSSGQALEFDRSLVITRLPGRARARVR